MGLFRRRSRDDILAAIKATDQFFMWRIKELREENEWLRNKWAEARAKVPAEPSE